MRILDTIKAGTLRIFGRRGVNPFAGRGFRRIYFVHIRKTGGTSLNHMFLSLMSEDSQKLYQELCAAHAVARKDLRVVGWRPDLIAEGNYFYGFSHLPLHELRLPAETFTVTCFRDPVKRVVSLYHMLREYAATNNPHPCMKRQGPWLGDSFDDFIDRIPPEDLLRQIYMFSKTFAVREAAEKIGQLGHVMFLEQFDAGVTILNEKTGLDLQPRRERKSNWSEQLGEGSLRRLRDKLSPEYELLDRFRISTKMAA